MECSALPLQNITFRTSAQVLPALREACGANPDMARFEIIGESREGRPIAGVCLGSGPREVTLLAGSHADEPVGPETLRTLVLEGLAFRDRGAKDGGMHDLFERFTFRIIPHINPDGEERNQRWISRWPDFRAWLLHRVREGPGDDIEFGYPEMRPENEAATRFLFGPGNVHLHASLHSMGVSEGALLLIDRNSLRGHKGKTLADRFRDSLLRKEDVTLHDHDRGGEKGFLYGGPGIWSIPEGRLMRKYFLNEGDGETANRFHRSSMEMAITAGEAPLCFVTEFPLFQITRAYEHVRGTAALAESFREEMPEMEHRLRKGEDIATSIEAYKIVPWDLRCAVRRQLVVLDLALHVIDT